MRLCGLFLSTAATFLFEPLFQRMKKAKVNSRSTNGVYTLKYTVSVHLHVLPDERGNHKEGKNWTP